MMSATQPIDPETYRRNRLAQLSAYAKQFGCPIYPHVFEPSLAIAAFREKYAAPEATARCTDVVQLAGRIRTIRTSGAKLMFIDICGAGTCVQILASAAAYTSTSEHFHAMASLLRRGDVLGAVGVPARSRTNELSLVAHSLHLLAPCLAMLPPENELVDVAARFQRRHLDLLTNARSYRTMVFRSVAIRAIRRFFDARGFLEVETPILSLIPSGASASPFRTHHNDLKRDMYLRVAPELALKQMIVAGFDAIYEIGKVFRNEGLDNTHNPEFTICEFYKTYIDYHGAMEITEDLLATLAELVAPDRRVPVHLDGPDQPPTLIDFNKPFRRVRVVPALEAHFGAAAFGSDRDAPTAEALIDLCQMHGIEIPRPATVPRLLDRLIGVAIEGTCIQPTFLVEHPLALSPLAKQHREHPHLTERFELFVGRREICNAYTELNDPADQASRFAEQLQLRDSGDHEANPPDELYIDALEHGLPPTGGWGLGVDRLIMLLTDHHNIREVAWCLPILPALRTALASGDGPAVA